MGMLVKGLFNWIADSTRNVKDFVLANSKLPVDEKVNNTIKARLNELFIWSKLNDTSSKKITLGTALISLAQVLTLPAVILGTTTGGITGAIAGTVSPKNNHKTRMGVIKDKSASGAQIGTRLAAILPSTWVGMGLAYLGEKCINSAAPLESKTNSTVEKTFELAHLLLNKKNIPVRLKVGEYSTNNDQMHPKGIIGGKAEGAKLFREINELTYEPKKGIPPLGNDLINKYIQHKKDEFILRVQPGSNLKQLQFDIAETKRLIDESERTELLQAALDHAVTKGEFVEVEIPKKIKLVHDITQNIESKDTVISINWQKASAKQRNKTNPLSKEGRRIANLRNLFNKNTGYKVVKTTSAVPSPFKDSDKLQNGIIPELDVSNEGGIPFKIYSHFEKENVHPRLECYPVLAEAVDAKLLPLKEHLLPVCTVAKNIIPSAIIKDNRYQPVKSKDVKPDNVMIVEVPYFSPDNLIPEDFTKLYWQIASAELNAFEDTESASEINNHERYIIQPLGNENTNAQHFIRAAVLLTEAALRRLPVCLPEESPWAYRIAQKFVESKILPEISTDATREDIIQLIAERSHYDRKS